MGVLALGEQRDVRNKSLDDERKALKIGEQAVALIGK